MAKNFSKFLGKIALMIAATLWAACNDSDKKESSKFDTPKAEKANEQQSDTLKERAIVYPLKLKKVDVPKVNIDTFSERISKGLDGLLQTVALYGVLPDVVKSTTIAENSSFSAINEDVKESVSHWIFPKTKNGATFSFPISFYGELPQPSMFDDSSSIKNK